MICLTLDSVGVAPYLKFLFIVSFLDDVLAFRLVFECFVVLAYRSRLFLLQVAGL